MAKDRVYHSDEWMPPDWPARIQQAQRTPTYEIGGTDYPRMRWGSEPDDDRASHQACPDCAALPGQFHVPGCDIEWCPRCGGQAIWCPCPRPDGC